MTGLELLAPFGLLALAGIPLVVILHMRHTTPRLRPVPTLRFWLAAMQEQSERSSLRRPPLTLLLLLHLLIVGLIAFALTRPATTDALAGIGQRTEPTHLILLLDGSTSMSARDTPSGGARFEDARAEAIDQIGDLREGDVATVVLLGTRTITYEATNAADLKALRDQLRAVKLPGGRAELNDALRLARDLVLPDVEDRVVVISDGALAADPQVVAEVGAPVDLVHVGGANTPNVAITDVATRASSTAAGEQQLYVRVANFGDAEVTVPVALATGEIEISRRDVTLEANGGAADLIWDIPAGATDIRVTVPVRDALSADNVAALVLAQEDDLSLRILYVSDAPSALHRALSVLPGAQIVSESTDSPVIADVGDQYDLVVYEGYTPPASSLPAAPMLFVHPPEVGLFPTQGVIPQPVADVVHAQDPLLASVDLAGVTFGETPIHVLERGQAEVVRAAGGPLIFRGTLGPGEHPTVVLAFDVATSNIAQRHAFPILIANVAAFLAPSPLPSSVALGDPLLYRARIDTAIVRVTRPDGEAIDLRLDSGTAPATEETAAEDAAAQVDQAELRDVAFSDTGQAGQYLVTELAEDGTEIGGGHFVVNAGHTRESDLRANPDLPAVLATAQAEGNSSSGSTLSDLWPALVAAAVAVLAFEWLWSVIPRRRRRWTPSPT